MTRKILLLISLGAAIPAQADLSDSGDLTIGGKGVIAGTMTVQGNAFSVGGATLAVIGGKVGIGTTGPVSTLTVEGAVKLGTGGTPLALISTGTYTPTASNLSNLSSVTPVACMYMRIGNLVQVQCGFSEIDPVSIGTATYELSLPFSSNFTSVHDLAGELTTVNVESENGGVYAETTNDAALVRMVAINTAAHNIIMHFMYTIK